MSASRTAMQRRPLQLTVLLVLIALLAYFYRDTLRTISAKWFTDMTYSHGGLIVPISLWLAWRARRAVAAAAWAPSLWGVLALACACLAWMVARAAGVLVIEQLAVVAMLSSVVLAVLGPQAYRPLAFPLAFLAFAVPFGRVLVPTLMQVTADITVSALRLSGVPVLRNDMLLSIPAGDFEIARACSGLNYLVTGVVLGTLYAYLSYDSWRKRIVFVAATLAVIVVANGIRAYVTVAVAHLSDMRYGTGEDHIRFGQALFLVVMFTMFWIGRRWRDPPAAQAISSGWRRAEVNARPAAGLVPLACLALLLGATGYVSTVETRTGTARDPAQPLIELPGGHSDWQGPAVSVDSWRPEFTGALEQRAAVYTNAAGGIVELYVGVYALGASGEGEMVSHRNRLYRHENRSYIREQAVALPADGGARLVAHQLTVPDARGARLVRYWFMVGDELTTSRTVAKWLEVRAILAGRAAHGRIVTLAVPAVDEDASERLDAFLRDHGRCATSGFAPGHCAA